MGDHAAGAPAPGGLLAALRAIGATLGETARVRGALLGVEFREEMERRKRMLVLVALAATFLHMALALLTLLVAVAFWETHRLAALGGLAALYACLGAAAILRLRLQAASSPPAFAATLGELDRDLAALGKPR
jgi:uncharacterized membrane protein YqjE